MPTLKKIFSKRWTFGFFEKADQAVSTFSPSEKAVFYAFFGAVFLTSLYFLYKVNDSFLVEIPRRGGTMTEGIVGAPRFINPLLSFSEADRDLTSLVYAGLLKATPEGSLVPHLAEEYSISEDGLVYSFKLRDNAYFHNGEKVTADDVIFTVEKAIDPFVKSPRRANWQDVTVEKISDLEVKFALKKPYSPFLENATLGILPKSLWKNIDPEQFPFSELNGKPVGAGPYKVNNVRRGSGGTPTYISLSSFDKYVWGEPWIKEIIIRFYPNTKSLLEAYKDGEISALNSISPEEGIVLKGEGAEVIATPLPRIFGIFFNQNKAPVLANKEVREALNISVDKKAVVEKVLLGYGKAIENPVPEGILKDLRPEGSEGEDLSGEERILKASNLLQKNGWTWNEEKGAREKKIKKETQILSFSISTSNAPELKETALLLKEMWEKIGAKIELKFFDTGDLNQSVIRPRKYDSLLFGEVVGRELDLYAFWHSSQRNDPGLNISSYTSIKADKLLEEARVISDKSKRNEDYLKLEEEIRKDVPAVFIYSPDFLYVVSPQVKGFRMEYVTMPEERFLNINEWYMKTEKVWEIFAR